MSKATRAHRIRAGSDNLAPSSDALFGRLDATRKRNVWLRRSLIAVLVIAAIGGLTLFYSQRYIANQQAALAERCRHAQADHDWPRLEELARQWATLQPDKSQPWIYAAEAARNMENPSMEATYLRNVGDDAPITAFYELGRLEMEVLNQPAAAYETCLRAARLYPSDSEIHARLLFYYSMTCQRQAVIDECNRAFKTSADILPTYAHWLSARWLTYTNGFDMNALWLRSAPDSELYYVATIVHLVARNPSFAETAGADSGEPKTALRIEMFDAKLREGLERYPDNIELQVAALAHYCQAGDIEAVARALGSAPAESADDSRFWRFKGWYHSALEQWQEAIAAYNQALVLNPIDWLAQHELATALRLTDQTELATALQQRASLGKELARSISLAERMDAIPTEMMIKMADYLEMCNQRSVADGLRGRLQSSNSAK